MARQKHRGPRVLGPYEYRGGWRVILVGEDGRRNDRYFEVESDAKKVRRALTAKLQRENVKPLAEAMEEYVVYLRHEKGNKMRSAVDTHRRLRFFFFSVSGSLEDLDEQSCVEIYNGVKRRITKNGKPPAVDTHRNALAEAKTFLSWCVSPKGWIKTNPLMAVKGSGKRKHGKPQLRVDEARKWEKRALELADRGEEGAIAALLTLWQGMRAGEVTNLQVRDVDDGGRLLWVADSKTAAGKRKLLVHETIQPYLSRLAQGRAPFDRLFGSHWRDWPRKWVQRICREAGVMEVTAHGMRGLHSSLAVESGMSSHAVAAALGHESFATTARSYAKPEAVTAGRQSRVRQALENAQPPESPPERQSAQ